MLESVKKLLAFKPKPLTVREALLRGVCPDCGKDEFLRGPHGCASQNIKCANPECGSEFNCAPFDDYWLVTDAPLIAERISEPQPLKKVS